eukprot:scaffold6450_cov79-Isochrysis_galbana.AAC.1
MVTHIVFVAGSCRCPHRFLAGGCLNSLLPALVVAQVTRNRGYEIKTLDNVKLIREVEELQMKLEDIQKGSFKHFMLKEICEQPEVRG